MKEATEAPEATATGSAASDRAYTWFCVVNNPQNMLPEGIPDEGIPQALLDIWLEDDPENTGAANLERADTGTKHSHLVLSSRKQSRFSKLRRLYGKSIHCEKMRGSRQRALDYITKTGKFCEKAHTVIVPPVFCGEIVSNPGRRTDLERVEEMIREGFAPRRIYAEDFRLRRFSRMIEQAYYDRMAESIPVERDVAVFWHYGESGSGKTYEYVKLCEERGRENVYLYDDFSSGGWDGYSYQPVLFIDELRDQIPFPELLRLLDGYPHQLHARYQNKQAAWNEVHVASVYTPRALYARLVGEASRDVDSERQLLRRIRHVVHHVCRDGEYESEIESP